MTGRPVDLGRVRRALEALDEAAARWPRLRTPEAGERLAAWLERGGPDAPPEDLGEPMGMEVTLQLRVPAELAARADALVASLDRTAAVAAGRATRSMVLRLALDEGLRAPERRAERRGGRTRDEGGTP